MPSHKDGYCTHSCKIAHIASLEPMPVADAIHKLVMKLQ